ncbi:MAG: diguanylate cyclase domain-containing protein, partial [Nitriliruptoraceae bacterium]
AVRACERMREALHRLDLAANDGRPLGPITASFGIATYEGGPADRSAMLAAADAALYAAKRAGRDRIVQATNDSELSTAP